MPEQQCECDPLDHGLDCPLRMPEQHKCDWKLGGWAYLCKGCDEELSIEQAEAMLNEYETLKKATDVLTVALRDRLLIAPGNETICTWCGSSWAIGSPHEWHDEDCPLYADTPENLGIIKEMKPSDDGELMEMMEEEN